MFFLQYMVDIMPIQYSAIIMWLNFSQILMGDLWGVCCDSKIWLISEYQMWYCDKLDSIIKAVCSVKVTEKMKY